MSNHQQPMLQESVGQYAVTPAVGPDPIWLRCPSCRQMIITIVDYKSNYKTHLMGLLCLLTCCLCACVPYYVDSCKNGNHYCPNCRSYIGTYKA